MSAGGVAGRPLITPKPQSKMADVCRVLDLQPYVLRYWQTEFPALAPRKGAVRREYSVEDLETIRRIKELLYDEGYTIASAKKKLAAELEEGAVRVHPTVAAEAQPNGGEPQMEEPEPLTPAAEEEDGEETPDVGEIGSLARRVERLEGGVAALVAQARQLAAELKPEAGAEDD